jgi:hypothetical protein
MNQYSLNGVRAVAAATAVAAVPQPPTCRTAAVGDAGCPRCAGEEGKGVCGARLAGCQGAANGVGAGRALLHRHGWVVLVPEHS